MGGLVYGGPLFDTCLTLAHLPFFNPPKGAISLTVHSYSQPPELK